MRAYRDLIHVFFEVKVPKWPFPRERPRRRGVACAAAMIRCRRSIPGMLELRRIEAPAQSVHGCGHYNGREVTSVEG
jgi:hypothetical protein